MTNSRGRGSSARDAIGPVSPGASAPPFALTPRELAVLRLLLDGQDSRAVATSLALSNAVLDRRLLSIRKKLSAKSTTEAAIKAIKGRLLNVPDAKTA